MAPETADKILDNVFKDAHDNITFAFQGGEPTLAGLPWFRHFVETVTSRKGKAAVHYSFQTNGLLLDGSWCEFFRENDFLVGLSIDVCKRFHNRNRLSADGGGTFETCMQSKELLEENHVEYNILCVLTNDIANEPDKVWSFIKNEKIHYIQFIPCLKPDTERESVNALRPLLFAKFYSRLLYRWIKELDAGNYISVKFFDDVVNYFFKGIPSSCGIDGLCRNQYVVEADGGVYPCDFYATDRYKIGNLTESTPREISAAGKTGDFLNEKPALFYPRAEAAASGCAMLCTPEPEERYAAFACFWKNA